MQNLGFSYAKVMLCGPFNLTKWKEYFSKVIDMFSELLTFYNVFSKSKLSAF